MNKVSFFQLRLLPLDSNSSACPEKIFAYKSCVFYFCFIPGQPLEEVPSKCEPSTVCSTRPYLSSDLSSVGLFLPGHSTRPQPLGRRTFLKFYHLEPLLKRSILICRTLLIFGSSFLMLNTARYLVTSLLIISAIIPNRFLSCAFFQALARSCGQ